MSRSVVRVAKSASAVSSFCRSSGTRETWAVESVAWACDSAVLIAPVGLASSAAAILVWASSSAACARSSVVCMLAKETIPPRTDAVSSVPRAAPTASRAMSTAPSASLAAVLAALSGSGSRFCRTCVKSSWASRTALRASLRCWSLVPEPSASWAAPSESRSSVSARSALSARAFSASNSL